MKTILFAHKLWRVHSQTETKLVLVPAANPLAAWRQREKLNQRDAATRLGISQGQLARIESGSRTISPDLLSRFSK